eukprot:Gb_07993 [translate_table: standard]
MELKTAIFGPNHCNWTLAPILTSSSASYPSYASSFSPPKPRTSGKICLALREAKNSFLGHNEAFQISPFQKGYSQKTPTSRPLVVAVVKRRKEIPLDNVIQRQKRLKLVSKIKDILVKEPNRMMSLKELGKYRRNLGLTKKRRVIALLKKYPGVFDIVEEGVYFLKFRLTPEAEKLYLEELQIRKDTEGRLVDKLRKILMMSVEKRVLLEKIAHLRTDLGLPADFKTGMCNNYPEYFKVVQTEKGPALELTSWDPALAVSAAELAEEESLEREIVEKNLIIDRPLKFNRVSLPKGLKLSRKETAKLYNFKNMPFFSPYADITDLNRASIEAEKHSCAVVHELLSMTIEKRTLVDHLTHFRDDYKFSQRIRSMLIRHPEMFYVSLKGDRDSVFLREAYRDSELIEKDPLVVAKERLQALVSIGRFHKRPKTVQEGGEENGQYSEEDEEGEDWSDAESSLDVGSDDDDNEWSDDVDDEEEGHPQDEATYPRPLKTKIPSNFVHRTPYKRVSTPTNQEKRELSTVAPDARPREQW